MKFFLRGLEKSIAQDFVAASSSGSKTVELATKYNVPFIHARAQAGCPGIMNPLGETPSIELEWGNGFCNPDKTARFSQFTQALESMEFYSNGDIEGLRNSYLALNVHGRVMLTYIAEQNNCLKAVLTSIADLASHGLDMLEVPYGKGGQTTLAIFDAYITPKFSFLQEESQQVQEVLAPLADPKLHEFDDNFVKNLLRGGNSEEEDIIKSDSALLMTLDRLLHDEIVDASTLSCPSIRHLLVEQDIDNLVAIQGELITEIPND